MSFTSSNKTIVQIAWALVLVVVIIGIARFIATRAHRSADQNILIEKSKQ